MTASTTRSTRREPVGGHVQPEDFRHRAACRSVDPEIFFPAAVAGREYARQVSIAKAVCAGCPVRPECLEWALAHQPDGIAGGLTEHDRRTEQARRRDARRRSRLPRPTVPRRPVGGSQREVAAAGQAALAAGASPDQVAGEFLVTTRTAQRWARTAHTTSTNASTTTSTAASGDVAEGSRGGNRAPLLISTQHNTQAGTPTTEGHRS